MKVARYKQLEIPPGVCLRCFNAQQQFAFPFLVYCNHHETLAVMRTPDKHMTFACAEHQLQAVLHKLQTADAAIAGLRITRDPRNP
jgi:hypothetical protein